jgi:hypothetical protein
MKKHIKEVRKDNPDLDSNREIQADRATDAVLDGFKFAKRNSQDDACEWCREHDGEIIPIMQVVDNKADHKYGHCTFTFLKEKP